MLVARIARPPIGLHPLQQVIDLDVGIAVVAVLDLAALAEQRVRLVEEQDRAAVLGRVEQPAQILLGLADIFADHRGEIDAVEIAGARWLASTSAAIVLPVPLSPANSALMPRPRLIFSLESPVLIDAAALRDLIGDLVQQLPLGVGGSTISSHVALGSMRWASVSRRGRVRASDASHAASGRARPNRWCRQRYPRAKRPDVPIFRSNCPASAAGHSPACPPDAGAQAARCSADVGFPTSAEIARKPRRGLARVQMTARSPREQTRDGARLRRVRPGARRHRFRYRARPGVAGSARATAARSFRDPPAWSGSSAPHPIGCEPERAAYETGDRAFAYGVAADELDRRRLLVRVHAPVDARWSPAHRPATAAASIRPPPPRSA